LETVLKCVIVKIVLILEASLKVILFD